MGPPGDINLCVLVSGQHCFEPVDLLRREQVRAGGQRDHRISLGVRVSPAGSAVDAAPLLLRRERRRRDASPVPRRAVLRLRLDCARRRRPRDIFDSLTKRARLRCQPGLEDLLRAALYDIQQSGGVGLVTDRGEVDDDGDVLAAKQRLPPDMLVDTGDTHIVKPVGIIQQKLLADCEEGGVDDLP